MHGDTCRCVITDRIHIETDTIKPTFNVRKISGKYAD